MIVSHTDLNAKKYALACLRDENVFVYPTDTLYGFGADASSEKALERLYDIKMRPASMPLSILVANVEMLDKYAQISLLSEKLIEAFLPGALTLVLPAKDVNLPKRLFNLESYLGFRLPDHKFCLDLAKEFNKPYVTTSVNISGQAPLNNINDIQKAFSTKVELMIKDEKLESSSPNQGSTVVMIDKQSNLKILREGVISERDIFAIL